MSKCSAVCEQVFLQVTANPTTVSRIGQEIRWTLRVTNTSGRNIPGPIVISSSFFGTRLLSEFGINAGETISLTVSTRIEDQDLQTSEIVNVTYVAYGIRAGMPGHFDVGEQISPVVTTTINVIIPDLDVDGTLRVVADRDIRLNFRLRNDGALAVSSFSTDLAGLFGMCDPTIINNPDGLFQIENKVLSLKSGRVLRVNEGRSVVIGLTSVAAIIITPDGPLCPNNCGLEFCPITYGYGSVGGAIIERGTDIRISRT